MFLAVMVTTALGALAGALLGYAGSCTSGSCGLVSSPWTGALVGGLVGLAMGMSLLARPDPSPDACEEAEGGEASKPGCGSGRKRFRFL